MSTGAVLPGRIARELDVLLEIIKADSAVKSIILFGSTATGARNADSDIDLLILVDDSVSNGLTTSARIRMAAYGKISFPFDLIVERLTDFEERKPFPTLERRIAREGKVLYAA